MILGGFLFIHERARGIQKAENQTISKTIDFYQVYVGVSIDNYEAKLASISSKHVPFLISIRPKWHMFIRRYSNFAFFIKRYLKDCIFSSIFPFTHTFHT